MTVAQLKGREIPNLLFGGSTPHLALVLFIIGGIVAA